MKLTPEKLAQLKAIKAYQRAGEIHATVEITDEAFRALIADLEDAQHMLTESEADNARLRAEWSTPSEIAELRKQLEEATAARGNGVLVPSPKLKEMQAEIRALRQQLAEAQAGEARALADMDQLCESGPSLSANEFELIRMTLETRPSGSAALDAAIAEAIEKYRKDAERLDWLMLNVNCDEIEALPKLPFGLSREEHLSAFRAAIDAAIAARKEHP